MKAKRKQLKYVGERLYEYNKDGEVRITPHYVFSFDGRDRISKEVNETRVIQDIESHFIG